MTEEPNGCAIAMALDVGEVVFIDEGRFLVIEKPEQVEAGEIRVMVVALDEGSEEIELCFPRPDAWIEIFRRGVE